MNTGLSYAEPQVALPPSIRCGSTGAKGRWEQKQVQERGSEQNNQRPKQYQPQPATHTHHQKALAVLELIVAQVQEV